MVIDFVKGVSESLQRNTSESKKSTQSGPVFIGLSNVLDNKRILSNNLGRAHFVQQHIS